MELSLPIFAGCATAEAALQLQGRLLDVLAPWHPHVQAPPER